MVREGRWVSESGPFSMAERNSPPSRLLFPSPALDGKLAVPLYFFNGVRLPRNDKNRRLLRSGQSKLRRKCSCTAKVEKERHFFHKQKNGLHLEGAQRSVTRRKAAVIL